MRSNFRKHKVIYSTIAIILAGFGIFLIAKNSYADTIMPASYDVGINSIIGNLQFNSISTDKRGLLVAFCDTLEANKAGFQGKVEGSSGAANMIYKPGYSLFVVVLCQPLGTDLLDKDDTDFVRNTFKKDWSVISGIPSSCNPKTPMASCDLSVLLQKIFTKVMNDHSTLALAGWTQTSEKSKDVVKDFSQRYFEGRTGSSRGEEICGNKDAAYISKKSSANINQAICSHPQTYSYLQKTIDSLMKKLDSMQIINPKVQEKIPDIHQIKDCPYKLLSCAYTTKKIINQPQYQVNAWYNELMYYRLLTAWIIDQYTNSNSTFSPLNLMGDNSQTTEAVNFNEIMNLQRELAVSQTAVGTMEKTISNFQASFPLHIGLLVYYEDILSLRKSLVKIYTPIHQLYYKLRNVQQKQ